MKYHWSEHRKGDGDAGAGAGQSHSVEILSMEEFRKSWPDIYRRTFSGSGPDHIRFCKADVLRGTVAGSFAIPSKEDPSGDKQVFGYCLTREQLIFMDDSGYVRRLLDEMQDYQMTDVSSPSLQLFDVMEYLLKEDVIFLQQYDDSLTRLEEGLLKRETEEFDVRILAARKDLSALSAYYEQLSDMGETLQQDAAERGNERDSLLFGLFSDKAGRLYSTVQMMKEYSMQLREMHQTQVDIRQNEIMKFLTIVTTVFMPLSLIAGWYGMNFVSMPELKFPYGYAVVCIVCLLIVALEIWFFKRKKWF